MAEQKVIITIPSPEMTARKSWAKHLVRINTSKTNGFAFEGKWLEIGRKAELEVGAYILIYHDFGSRTRTRSVVQLLRVTPDANLELIMEVQGDDWAIELRDKAAELVNRTESEAAPNPLSGFTDEQLIAELQRRGYSVMK